MMLKRSHKLQLNNYSPNELFQSSQSKFYEEVELNKLFQPPYRQMFQLDYLYSSPLCSSYPAYVEVIKLLENFNADTVALEHYQTRYQSPLKILCMRFIYRQMLTIAVMDKHEISKNDYATKLKNWYYQLSEKHSFLEGINFKRRKTDEEKLEQMIRKSFVSNVFDEIDDYFRKRLSYQQSNFQKTFQKENFYSEKRRTTDQSQLINLPLIDIQLYKREQELLRKYREKEIQSKYIHDIRTNKNKMRQVSLNNIKNRQFKNSIAVTEPRTIGSYACSFHSTLSGLKNQKISKSSKSLIGKLDLTEHLDWRKKPSQIPDMIEQKKTKNRLTLININGINLIHSKFE